MSIPSATCVSTCGYMQTYPYINVHTHTHAHAHADIATENTNELHGFPKFSTHSNTCTGAVTHMRVYIHVHITT